MATLKLKLTLIIQNAILRLNNKNSLKNYFNFEILKHAVLKRILFIILYIRSLNL
jgi:hypothetical protein